MASFLDHKLRRGEKTKRHNVKEEVARVDTKGSDNIGHVGNDVESHWDLRYMIELGIRWGR